MEFIPAKTIVTKTKSTSWFGTEYNMNIYRGCCHGCIYCDSRSDCYHVENFDTVRAKKDALLIIRDDLQRKVRSGVVATGSMSDPYNPFEKELQLTRHALELLDAYEFGVAIATKSPLVTRDMDILRQISDHSPVIVKITITTADDALSMQIERNVPPSSERFAAIKKLSENGIYCGVLLMPILPFINDTKENILGVVRLAKESGARFIYPAFGVTLRGNQQQYYYEKLDDYFPSIKEKYIRRYGNRYSCGSPNASALFSVFASECERLGLLYKMQDIVRSYRLGYGDRQLSFL